MSQTEMINIMILFVIGVGIVILIIGLVFIKDKSHSNQNSIVEDQLRIEKELKLRIEEADKMLQELNQFSSYIKLELEKKYKELLFLYQIIEEKQKNLSFSKTEEDKNSVNNDIGNEQDFQASTILNNKHYDNVIKLYKSGKDTASIAKQLNIGKGEVELILSLVKMR